MINIREHREFGYAARTKHNAEQGVTLAVAVDFTTGGERLTTKCAKGKIVHFDARNFTSEIAAKTDKLIALLKENNCRTVNVAGNGIYTYKRKGFTQEGVNSVVYMILKRVHEKYPLEHIVSGGQSGADLAGLIAAAHIGIDCTGTWPRGYVMRFEDGVDVGHTPTDSGKVETYGNMMFIDGGSFFNHEINLVEIDANFLERNVCK